MQNKIEGPLVRCGLWLHIGFIGATAVAAGLLLLFQGEAKWLSALALIVTGGMMAAVGWYRGRVVLDSGEQAHVVPSHAHRRRTPASSSVTSGG